MYGIIYDPGMAPYPPRLGRRVKTLVLHRPQKQKQKKEHFPSIIIETGVWSKSAPHKAWRNTVIVLPALSLLRHRGATERRPESPSESCRGLIRS